MLIIMQVVTSRSTGAMDGCVRLASKKKRPRDWLTFQQVSIRMYLHINGRLEGE